MKIPNTATAVKVIDWLNLKKFKYNINLIKSDALHGIYYLDFRNKEEELIAQITWGLV